jgi:hypothetical protein
VGKLRVESAQDMGGSKRGRPRKDAPRSGKKHLVFILSMLESTRFLPTAELFDAIWQVAFWALQRWGEGPAVEYLKNTYFSSVPIPILQKIFPRVREACWGAGGLGGKFYLRGEHLRSWGV